MRIVHHICLVLALSVGFGAQADEIDDLIDQFFKEADFVGKITEDFPEEREGAEARMRAAFETGSSDVAKQAGFALGRDLGVKYSGHYMSITSDEAVLTYLNMLQVVTRELATTDGPTCFKWSFGVPGISAPQFKSGVEKIMTDAQSRIVHETGDSVRVLEAEAFEAMSGKIGNFMATHLNADHLYFDGLTNPDSVKEEEAMRKTCLTWWGYLAAISMLPQDDAVMYFRTMMTSE